MFLPLRQSSSSEARNGGNAARHTSASFEKEQSAPGRLQSLAVMVAAQLLAEQ
jgi:hypothetical protein